MPSLARRVTKQMTQKKSPPSTRKKHFQLNLRVSDTARAMLEKIGEKHGMNLTHALEYAIRQTARTEGVWNINGKSNS